MTEQLDILNQPKAVAGKQGTSKAAAEHVLPKTGTQRHRVLIAIANEAERGATDEELQQWLAMNPNTQRPRRVELVKGGYIVDSGRRRDTHSGDAAIVWVATQKAFTELRAQAGAA